MCRILSHRLAVFLDNILRIIFRGWLMDTSEKYVKMCEAAKSIQHQWNGKVDDYIYDPADGEARVWFGYPPKESDEIVWLPRQDQLQEICVEFFIRIMGLSEHEAFFHFLEWYAACLKETFDIGCNIGEYEEIDSCEKLMLKYTMRLIHWKKWDGERWE
jgi:hypothetical protein